ncbi:MAG: toxin-antitoxin system HicB family antitoxin [Candidatus Omnitrophota bacterium]|jgi:FAD synthase|nr:MAG: toxin-antitoxin system HicB family antitoxin [Candidatus Omnitrophota bacterium]
MPNNKKNVLTIRVPEELKEKIEKYSALQGVSINQFALYAFTKELAELETNRYFTRTLREKSKQEILQNFDQIMSRTPNREVPDWDQLEP